MEPDPEEDDPGWPWLWDLNPDEAATLETYEQEDE